MNASEIPIPPHGKPIAPQRLRGLADHLKIHGRNRRGSYPPEIADKLDELLDRLVIELAERDRAQAADQAAAKRATTELKQWSEGYAIEHGTKPRPDAQEVLALMNAQFQADQELTLARREVATAGLPAAPQPTGDPAADFLARVRWLPAALPAAEQQADILQVAAPAAAGLVVELREERDRYSGVIQIASAVLPGVAGSDPDPTIELPLPPTQAIEEVAS